MNYHAEDSLREAFIKWQRETSRTSRVHALRDQFKESVLKGMNRLFLHCTNDSLGYYMSKWKVAAKDKLLMRRFVNKLLYQTHGLKYQAFDRWRRVTKESHLALRAGTGGIELAFSELIRKRYRDAFDALKEGWIADGDIKRRCIRKIIASTMDRRKRYFAVWARNADHFKYIQGCRKLMTLMTCISSAARSSLSLILTPDTILKQKKTVFFR